MKDAFNSAYEKIQEAMGKKLADVRTDWILLQLTWDELDAIYEMMERGS